jgi:hypothetical protein
MWESHGVELTQLLEAWADQAPEGSLFAVELEQRTALNLLPKNLAWEVRLYSPAQVAIAEVEAGL